MSPFRIITVILSMSLYLNAIAQPTYDDCAQAQKLCPKQAVSANNISATAECGGADGDCLSVGTCYTDSIDNSVWFSFTTNSSGGSATVNISNISCTTGDSLQGALLSTTTSCSGTYTTLACQAGDSGSFSLTASSLSPTTIYVVHIDGVNAAQCNFNISVSGTAVDWTITTSSTDASCGVNDGTATVSVTDATSPTYLWSNSQTTSTATGLAAGTYPVTITDANNCTDTTSVTVNQPSTPTINASANNLTCTSQTGSISVTPTGGTSPYSYELNDEPTTYPPGFNGLSQGTYRIKIIDSKNCTSSDTVEVLDECIENPVKAADAFSPNGDGINDTWAVSNLSDYQSSKVLVYDRWGQKVFRSKEYDKEPWDGKSLGFPVPAATYYFVIEVTKRDGNNDIITGFVAIVR